MRRSRKKVNSSVILRRRLLLTILLLSGVMILGRASQIQIFQRAHWRQQAEQQHRTSVEVIGPRGSVIDSKGVDLAISRELSRVSLAPREILNVEYATKLLSETLGLSRDFARTAVTSSKRWYVLPNLYPPSVREALTNVPGFYLEREYHRSYPRGELARGILGDVRDGKGYGGIEKVFDESLRGSEGRAVLTRNHLGHTIPGERLLVKEPEVGGQVVLTLDVDLQEIGHQVLKEAVEKTESQGGDLLITDPRTGDILAMISIRDGSTKVLSAINTPYEPGSTLKPFTVASLLEYKLASLEDTVDTEEGHWTVEGRTISDVHPEGGVISIAHALEISSNVGVAKAAQVMTPAIQYETLRDFGLGVPTGVGLPGEVRGTLRRPEHWSLQSPVSLAIGYEVSVTPLQMAMAYGALANGGRLMRPRIVKEVRDASGRTVDTFQPRLVRQVVSESVTQKITDVLVNVVEDGTGTRARLSTFAVAGKSGTSRAWSDGGYQSGDYFSSFVGFFPAKDPQVVVLVKLDKPKGAYYGGATAAPVTRATLESILASRQTTLNRGALAQVARTQSFPSVSPILTEAVPLNREVVPYRLTSIYKFEDVDPSPDILHGSNKVIVPDVTGLPARSAVRRMHNLGLRVHWEGYGSVTITLPVPGSLLTRGDTVHLSSRTRKSNG